MGAQELARQMRDQLIPLLDESALSFFDTYFDAAEWEISIGMAAETLFKHGLQVPDAAFEYEEEISSTVVEEIRRARARRHGANDGAPSA